MTLSVNIYLHVNVHCYPRPSHLSGKGHYSHISDSAISHSSGLMQHLQFSLFFGICTCCWPTLTWNRHTSPNEYVHLEQEAKMSSQVWICHQLYCHQPCIWNAVIVPSHCLVDWACIIAGWSEAVKLGGRLIALVSSWKATNLHLLHSSILFEANKTDRQMLQWH